MMYRAKVTVFADILQTYPYWKDLNYVKDAKDIYVEVNNADIAESLEAAEKECRQRLEQINKQYN